MQVLKKLNPEWALRVTLGLMYLYSGVDIVRHPSSWTWAIRSLPTLLSNQIASFGVERFLFIQGVGEIILALIFLMWFLPRVIVKYAGLFTALEMAAIVVLVGLDAVTFRDLGLTGAGLALFLILNRYESS